MFEQAKYVENGFSVTFPRQIDIRRKANDIEDILKSSLEGHYSQPQIIPIPDELDPQVPRIIFGSTHGFSQIVISQINVSLNVRYSEDWQLDISKGQEYLQRRVPVLFKIVDSLKDIMPYFSGCTTKVVLHTKEDDDLILKQISNIFLKETELRKTHDIQLKITKIISDQFFSNITISNLREWQLIEPPLGIPRLSRKDAATKGIQIIGDYNDRYAFNENKKYLTEVGLVDKIISKGLAEINVMIRKLTGETK